MAYQLFNFEGPIVAAVETVIGMDAILEREDADLDDIAILIRFSDGQATGHTYHYNNERIYDVFRNGTLTISVRRARSDPETVAGAVTARDKLAEIVATIRHKLRSCNCDDHLNNHLTSPTLKYLIPQGTSYIFEEEPIPTDIIDIVYSVDAYGIPAEVWPNLTLNATYGYLLP